MEEKIRLTMESPMPEVRKMNIQQFQEFTKAGLNPQHSGKYLKMQHNILKMFARVKEAQAKGEDAEYDYDLIDQKFSLDAESANWVLANVYPDFDFTEADLERVQELTSNTIAYSNGAKKDDLKNSSRSGDGTGSEPTTAPTA